MILNFSKQLARRIQINEKVAIVWNRTSPQCKIIFIKRCTYHTSQGNKSFCCSEFVCKVRNVAGLFSPWSVLQKLGVPYKLIILFRRKIKRLALPLLVTSLRAALTMGMGDIVAQVYHNCFNQTCEKKHFTSIDLRRTAKFMLTSFFVLGPLFNRFNRILVRRLSFYPPHHYLIQRTALRVLVLSPIALMLAMFIYDHKQVQACFPDFKTLWNKKYKLPFKEIMMLNLMTRPLIEMLICLFPHCVRPFVRSPYEVLFSAFASSVIHKYKLGTVTNICRTPPPPKSKRFCKSRKSCSS